ncbi:S8 family peptidase [Alkalibacillus haloalkaliphilus]|uniref:Subtilisin E n=1 Tax=Alkalibacillus haloalkaliphilus TaxID=94136 RepID=A0A511W5F1_9BACI|nr:S8 family peptidase [Alkalibacillus haloalkaliphilus]GEN46325.1 subtilisin E [Alkalibacillus haloalkaliphilus]
MKKLLIVLSTILLLFIPFQHVFAAETQEEKSDYLVMFDGPAKSGILKAFGVDDEDVLHSFDLLPVYHLNLTDGQANGLQNHPHIEHVESNADAKAFSQTVPWGVPHVQGTTAQDAGYTGNGVKVAILDTGIDASHEDLNVVGGYSVFDDSANNDPFYDGSGHGTHVAGTVAALDNNVGVLGVAPQSDLYAVKVLNNSGSGSYAGIAEGLEWSIQNDMDIVNMSLGGSQSSSILEAYTDLANDEGVLVVAAAGNSGNRGGNNDSVGYPAKYDSAIAVAAIDQNNNRATFSSTGPAVELSAPGVNVLSTVPGDNYDSYNGTSMAAPHVAGVAAQVWDAKPHLSNTELRELLQQTAQNLGPSHRYGHGLVQSFEAISH